MNAPVVFRQRKPFPLPLVQNDELDGRRVAFKHVRVEKGAFHDPPAVPSLIFIADNENIQPTINLDQVALVDERFDDVVFRGGHIEMHKGYGLRRCHSALL